LSLLLPPKYLAGLFAFMMAIFLGTTLLEYQYRKSEIEHLMREEAVLLLHALKEGAENAISGYNENSSLLVGSLIDQLHLLDRIDKKTALTSSELSEIAGSGGLYRINIFDRHGKRVAFNTPDDHEPVDPPRNPLVQLKPIFSGAKDSMVIGIRESRSKRGSRLIAAVARSRGGAIVGNIDASRLITLRRQLGVGRLIQRIGADTTGIDYIILQDSSAILAATPNVTGVESIQSDSVLSKALLQHEAVTRWSTFDGRKVFEVVKPLMYNNINVGLLRIGLKTDHFIAAQGKLRNRFIMFLGIGGFSTLILFNLVMTRRNEVLMKQAYKRVQTFSSTILESMADAVVVVNDENCITLLNSAAERLLGLTFENVAGKPVEEVLPDIADFLRVVMLEQSQTLNKELEMIIHGQKLLLSIQVTLVSDNESRGKGALAVVHDLTEQRSLQRIISRQEKLSAMGELASGVAHEIRNPLNAIGVIAQRLDIEFSPRADEDEFHQLLRAVVSEVHRVNAIIQRFLQFATPAPLMMVKTDIKNFLLSYRPLLESESEAKNIKFSLQLESAPMVLLDHEKMQQVLLNIVQNGVEATSSGGIIAIKLFCRKDEAVIELSDSGSGISEGDMSQIFNLYFTTKENGTGLGLSIANQIIQLHGGLIEVESIRLHGTLFRIVLPLA